MFKGVKQQFNSCTEQALKILLRKINHVPKDVAKADGNFQESIYGCLSVTMETMAEFTAKQHTAIIWRSFYVSALCTVPNDGGLNLKMFV